MNTLEELHLDSLQKDKHVRKQLCVNDFGTSKLEESVASKSAEITEQISIEFLEWCNYQVVNPQKVLGFDKRVTPQYPDFKTYIILNNKGENILPEGKFLTTKELFQEFLKQRQ